MEKNLVIEAYKLSKQFKSFESKTGEKGLLTSLRRRYVYKKAVYDVTFTMKKGEFVALLGKNGAGKSTLVKLLVGIIKADSGEARLFGIDPYSERVKLAMNIGVVLGAHEQMWEDLAAIDTFKLMEGVYGIPKTAFDKRLSYFIKVFNLEKVYRKQVRQMSLGERMKCNFIASMLHMPKLVIMDEPTIGMDSQSKSSLFKALQEIRKRYDITFLLATNMVEEAEELADRILLMDEGTLVYDGLPRELIKLVGGKKEVEIRLRKGARNMNLGRFGRIIAHKGDYIKLEMDGRRIKGKKLLDLLTSDNVLDYSISEPPLDEVLNKFYSLSRKRLG